MSSESLQDLEESSPLSGSSSRFIERYYEQYLKDPDSVEKSWRDYFESLNGDAGALDVAHSRIWRSFARRALHTSPVVPGQHSALAPEAAEKQSSVLRLINAYRMRGHQAADLDPLGLFSWPAIPDLDLAYHGLGENDMETVFHTGSLAAEDNLPLREILRIIRETYVGTIGAEYMYITDTRQKRWIQKRLEGRANQPRMEAEQKKRILKQLTAAEGIERYLHTRYVGQKRFSLEGADSLIPALDELVHRAVHHKVEEIVIGMAHRGRLNVLVNVLGKSPKELFEEFEGKYEENREARSGDVKYHLGFSTDEEIAGRKVHLVLAFNPSHLETVNPVVEGSVRARQDRRGDACGEHILPVLIHGDAAFAGQGVVMETLQLSQAKGYATGGTVHILVNNQLGFTTAMPIETELGASSRTSRYCTDIAKMLEAPVFHVNAEDPEAVNFITRLAMDFRAEFHKDVIVDLISYRRHGHNEADEPAVTQPMMYKQVKSQDTVRTKYARKLVNEGSITDKEVEQLMQDYRDGLDKGQNVAVSTLGMVGNEYTVDWSPYRGTEWDVTVDTGVPVETIRRLSDEMLDFPEGFELHKRVQRIMSDRRKMAQGATPADWGFAENMAYATLLEDGYSVRFSGQDSGRGTFFHRHALIVNQKNGDLHIPLQKLKEGRGSFTINDTLLSEEGVLGYEYGYSTAEPNSLVIWEAQYGDFCNGAQVLIDQFIASGFAKWGRYCGLVMFLPHGYEGQGPEHSSARLERFLQLCAENNQQVCVPSTAAQMFHMLRRQMIRPYRRPLIVMTPKSMLRHRPSFSTLEEFAEGHFHNMLDEADEVDPKEIKRLVLCSGKVYYDLYKARKDQGIEGVALIRLEQIYPFPKQEFAAFLERYPNAEEIVWCQEEPENQGPWYQIKHRLQNPLTRKHKLLYATRPGSATTAVGYHKLHVQQQEDVIKAGLTGGEVLNGG